MAQSISDKIMEMWYPSERSVESVQVILFVL